WRFLCVNFGPLDDVTVVGIRWSPASPPGDARQRLPRARGTTAGERELRVSRVEAGQAPARGPIAGRVMEAALQLMDPPAEVGGAAIGGEHAAARSRAPEAEEGLAEEEERAVFEIAQPGSGLQLGAGPRQVAPAQVKLSQR